MPTYWRTITKFEPLTGEAYVIDLAQVHILIANFVSGNETVEAKIQSFAAQTDGRIDYQSLVDHYEGVRVHVMTSQRQKQH